MCKRISYVNYYIIIGIILSIVNIATVSDCDFYIYQTSDKNKLIIDIDNLIMPNTNGQYVELFQLSDELCQKITSRVKDTSLKFISALFYNEYGIVDGYLRIGLFGSSSSKLGMLYLKGIQANTQYNNHAQLIINY